MMMLPRDGNLFIPDKIFQPSLSLTHFKQIIMDLNHSTDEDNNERSGVTS